jgi:hypothetical protein
MEKVAMRILPVNDVYSNPTESYALRITFHVSRFTLGGRQKINPPKLLKGPAQTDTKLPCRAGFAIFIFPKWAIYFLPTALVRVTRSNQTAHSLTTTLNNTNALLNKRSQQAPP